VKRADTGEQLSGIRLSARAPNRRELGPLVSRYFAEELLGTLFTFDQRF